MQIGEPDNSVSLPMENSRLKKHIISYHLFRNKGFYWFVAGFLFFIAAATAFNIKFNFAILGIIIGTLIYLPETLMYKFKHQAYKKRLGLFYPKLKMPDFLYKIYRVSYYLVIPALITLIYLLITYPVFDWGVMCVATLCWLIFYSYLLSIMVFPIVGNVLKVIVDDTALTVFWEGASSDENIFTFAFETTKYKLLNDVLWMSSPDTFNGRMFDLNLATFTKEDKEAIIQRIKDHKNIRVIREVPQLRVA